ncbi:MAG: class I SAM-dependent methyltransferase [Bacteroidota bacterium]|nr:class I SAM-dependent methyltransferase [Bacteroidota bacterium]
MSEYFKEVIALDASEAQINSAHRVSNVEYKIAKAEATGLGDKSADLVTIATAIHWMETDLFYTEARRILKDDGVIAVWTYSTKCEIDSETDNLINGFSEKVLNEHWDPDIKKVWNFEEIEFPFIRIPAPDFKIRRVWTLEEFLNYIFTWSSLQKYIEIHNSIRLNFLEVI